MFGNWNVNLPPKSAIVFCDISFIPFFFRTFFFQPPIYLFPSLPLYIYFSSPNLPPPFPPLPPPCQLYSKLLQQNLPGGIFPIDDKRLTFWNVLWIQVGIFEPKRWRCLGSNSADYQVPVKASPQFSTNENRFCKWSRNTCHYCLNQCCQACMMGWTTWDILTALWRLLALQSRIKIRIRRLPVLENRIKCLRPQIFKLFLLWATTFQLISNNPVNLFVAWYPSYVEILSVLPARSKHF